MNLLKILPRRSALVLGVALLAAAGCDQLKGGGGAAKGSAKSCDEFAARVCKDTGDTSPSCKSVKDTLPLLTADACASSLANVSQGLKALGDVRKKCTELTTKLCTDIGEKTATCEMVKNTTQTFTIERCGEMMDHYAEVLGGLKQQEQKNKPLSPALVGKLIDGSPPAFGPKDSKVILVEFSDFECPYCSRAANAVHEVKQKYGDKVHFVFRQFPLVMHQHAKVSAEASLAAHAQGKFWEFHDKLFANQRQLDRPALEGYAKDLGLNVDEFKKALDDKKYAATVDAELKLGEEVAVDGTPTIFLNGKRVQNPLDATALSKEIDEALKASGT